VTPVAVPVCPSCRQELTRTPGTGLILPFPPATNNLYASVNGRRILSARGKAYKQEVGYIALESHRKPVEAPLRVYVDIYRPRRIGDVDNALKIVLDSLTGHLYIDDGLIVEIHARRYEDAKNPRVEVWIEEQEPCDDTSTRR
jgi:crossover junction endodeoxyribonuclease RusA